MTDLHQPDSRKVVVIGPCASGKTSLTNRLRDLGYDAYVCGQEHSEIVNLWKRLAPDVLIALDIDLETLRRRRSATWSHRIFERQLERLRCGFEHADLVVDAASTDEDDVLRQVVDWLAIDHGHPR